MPVNLSWALGCLIHFPCYFPRPIFKTLPEKRFTARFTANMNAYEILKKLTKARWLVRGGDSLGVKTIIFKEEIII